MASFCTDIFETLKIKEIVGSYEFVPLHGSHQRHKVGERKFVSNPGENHIFYVLLLLGATIDEICSCNKRERKRRKRLPNLSTSFDEIHLAIGSALFL